MWTPPRLAVAALLAFPGGAAMAACEGQSPAEPQTYQNSRFGYRITFPAASFTLIPDTSDSDESVQFIDRDGQVTAIVTALANHRLETRDEHHRDAVRDITQNSGGSITYERRGHNWLVLSGYIQGRIYYRRTLLLQGGLTIATLWMEFPPELRPCIDPIVTMMANSFGPR